MDTFRKMRDLMRSSSKMNDFLSDYSNIMNEKDKKIDRIMADTSYILWIDGFLKDNEVFYEDDLDYSKEVSEADRDNIRSLHLLFREVDKYALTQGLVPNESNIGFYYSIRLDDKGFIIGVLIGQGAVSFVQRVSIDDEKSFIDFNDVIDSRKKSKQRKRS